MTATTGNGRPAGEQAGRPGEEVDDDAKCRTVEPTPSIGHRDDLYVPEIEPDADTLTTALTGYRSAVLGEREGFLAVAFGDDPYCDDTGKYTHHHWHERRYPWPAGYERLAADLARQLQPGKRVDMFVCPAVRASQDRRKGSALPLTVCWADLDGPTVDEDLVARLDPYTVESGSDGHLHLYVRLSKPVQIAEWEPLQRSLRDRLGGDNKITDNDLLRLPGTLNHKIDPPAPVRVLRSSGRVWKPGELAELLGVDSSAPRAQRKRRGRRGVAPDVVPTTKLHTGESIPDPLPDQVRQALDYPDTDDRSVAHHRVIEACYDAGLTCGQALTVATGYSPSVEKYGARLATEVDRSWRVIDDGRRRRHADGQHPDGDIDSASETATVSVQSITLAEAHATFRRWFGDDYDVDALDAVLCTLAAERLDGDPLWLLVISGSGNAKTETVQAAAGVGAIVTSTISSEGALLSATPIRERSNDATGGLLRELGSRGVLVIKDVTSILSMSRETRGGVLAALREVHDGHWARNVGTNGGRTLTWQGRAVVIGAVTTTWDRAHDVIASMGDRFVLLRMDSTRGRIAAGRQAIGNTGSEDRMRAELAAAVAGVLAGLDSDRDLTPIDDERDRLLAAADLVTLARTGVDYDYRGDVIDAHAPEMPTRFAKQLTQIMRGGIALGMSHDEAMRLAIRCARDSMPPLRLAILLDIAAHPEASTSEVRKRLSKPRPTVDRQLQALHMLNVLVCDEDKDAQERTVWRYRLADGIDPTALDPPSPVPDLSVHRGRGDEEGTSETERLPDTSRTPTDISGTASHPGAAKPATSQGSTGTFANYTKEGILMINFSSVPDQEPSQPQPRGQAAG